MACLSGQHQSFPVNSKHNVLFPGSAYHTTTVRVRTLILISWDIETWMSSKYLHFISLERIGQGGNGGPGLAGIVIAMITASFS